MRPPQGGTEVRIAHLRRISYQEQFITGKASVSFALKLLCLSKCPVKEDVQQLLRHLQVVLNSHHSRPRLIRFLYTLFPNFCFDFTLLLILNPAGTTVLNFHKRQAVEPFFFQENKSVMCSFCSCESGQKIKSMMVKTYQGLFGTPNFSFMCSRDMNLG